MLKMKSLLLKLVFLAFFGSVGMTLVAIGCSINANWSPFFVVIFYIIVPIPLLFSRRVNQPGLGSSSTCQELAIFMTMGIIVSAFALPVVLHRAPVRGSKTGEKVITLSALLYVYAGNTFVFSTIIAFFLLFGGDDMGMGFNSW